MRKEEERLQEFLKENGLKDLDFSWGTGIFRHYVAKNSKEEEVYIRYNTDSEEITFRVE